MMTFASMRTVPPGGRFFYEIPEFSIYVESLSWLDLLVKVESQYRANKVPVPVTLSQMIQDYMCRKLPKGFCQGGGGSVRHPVTLDQVKGLTSAIIAAGGRELVSPLDAKQRAETCANCPKNDRSTCPSCVGLNAWAERQVKQKVPGSELWLGICGVDDVSLMARVHLVDAGKRTAEHPEGCWLT